MATCEYCGSDETLPYNCRYCGGQFCSAHRLPENHDCPGLDEAGGEAVFDSGFSASVETDTGGGARSRLQRMKNELMSYVRGNLTYVFLVGMWLVFIAQWLVIAFAGDELHRTLFVLAPQHPEYVWTWITSIFAHDPIVIWHIIFNSIVIFFFGPLVERYLGSRRFGLIFLLGGILAGLSQIGYTIASGPVTPSSPGVLGASGAALAIMGVITVLNPNLRVYLYAIIPMPVWVLTAGIAAISILFIGAGDAAVGGVAHAAHLVGLVVGLGYGAYFKRTHQLRTPNQIRLGSGGPPRRGRW